MRIVKPVCGFPRYDAENAVSSLMRCCYGGPCRDNPEMAGLALYVPRIFDKIADNPECYPRELEQESTLND